MFNFMYKISAFGNFTDIEPTPDNMLIMLNAFKKYNMVPTIFQEMTFDVNVQQVPIPNPLQRLSVVSSDSSERILISTNRLDFEILASDGKNLDEVGIYAEKIIKSFETIMNHYKKNSNRLAFNTSSHIVNIDEENIKNILGKFSNPIEKYKKDILDEWGIHLMTRDNITICGESETLNIITNINKVKILKAESNIFGDGFRIDMDINTIAEKNSLRFNANSFKEFISSTNKIENDIFTDIIKLLE